jgi:hypothetical protein
MLKNCPKCVYRDGIRIDGTTKCTSYERQHDGSITDCCIPEAPLRELQKNAASAGQFIYETQRYVSTIKSQSKYWSSQTKLNGV